MTLAALGYLALGMVATALAALRLAAWSATGLLLGVGSLRASAAIRSAVAILAGACLTAVVYAVLASVGWLGPAIALDAIVAAVSLAVRSGDAATMLRASARALLPSSRIGRSALAAVLGVAWIVAIGPPRDGDVMHYHLAHIREIIAHGMWRQLPICSYGIPFGWSMTYLPFEWMGLPQTAHLLNAGAWLLTCALCAERVSRSLAPETRVPRMVIHPLLLGATLIPAILKSSTTAMADSFTILVVAVVVALLLEWPRLERGGAVALGFVAFCGLTTRYQAAAIAIAVCIIVAVDASRHRESRTLVMPFLAGTLVALAAAAPFYIANAVTLGTPLWPFATGLAEGGRAAGAAGMTQPVQQLASACATRAVAGGLGTVVFAVGRLLVDQSVFPIPLLVAVGCVLALTLNRGDTRRVGIFILLFMGAWVAAQPTLAPRFSIYLLAAGMVCVAPPLSRLPETRAAPVLRVAGGATLGALAIGAAVYARDYVLLAVSGDLRGFHRATWYWPAYDWANRETPADARFVVALYGGDTYPLDRWNVSADPASSAVVPWQSLANSCDLADLLRDDRADFMFYGPDVWTGRPMNEHIDRIVNESIRAGVLDSVRTFDVPIVYSRVRRLEVHTTITLYRVDRTAIARSCAKAERGSRLE